MNPVNINPLLTVDKSCTYVQAASADVLYKAGMEHFEEGRYQEASQLLNNLVMCEPTNIKYRLALADSYEQQGYQSETMAWRNTYLQGAVELRTSQIGQSLKISWQYDKLSSALVITDHQEKDHVVLFAE